MVRIKSFRKIVSSIFLLKQFYSCLDIFCAKLRIIINKMILLTPITKKLLSKNSQDAGNMLARILLDYISGRLYPRRRYIPSDSQY